MQVRKVMKYTLTEAEKIALNTALDIIDKVADNFSETETFRYTDFDTTADTINTIIECSDEDLLDQVGEIRPFLRPVVAGHGPNFGKILLYQNFCLLSIGNLHKVFIPKPRIFVQYYHLKSALGCAIIVNVR